VSDIRAFLMKMQDVRNERAAAGYSQATEFRSGVRLGIHEPADIRT